MEWWQFESARLNQWHPLETQFGRHWERQVPLKSGVETYDSQNIVVEYFLPLPLHSVHFEENLGEGHHHSSCELY